MTVKFLREFHTRIESRKLIGRKEKLNLKWEKIYYGFPLIYHMIR